MAKTKPAVVPVADAVAFEAQIRDTVTKELEEKHAKQVREAVDAALVQYHGRRSVYGGNMEGRFTLDDRFSAYASRGILTESWMPLVVRLGEGEEITETTVRRAVDDFVSGFPLFESSRIPSIYNSGSQERLLKAMRSSDQKALLDPHATTIVNMFKNYIAGQQVRIGCPHNKKVDEVIRSFWRQNFMSRRIKHAVGRKVVTGEHFFFYFVSGPDRDILVRDRCHPWDIGEIECHSDDAETRLAYGRCTSEDASVKQTLKWYKDVGYEEQAKMLGWGQTSQHALEPDVMVQMVKYGGLSDVRGVTPLYPILRFLKYYEDFLTDRIILNHERSKVVWVKVIKGSGNPEMSRTELGPQGGQVLYETPTLEWKAINANINASDAKEDGRLIRLAISAGVGMPEHILFQDASEAVYSSLRTHDTPFAQTIRSHQEEWMWDVETMLRVVIREKVAAGKLSAKSKQQMIALEAWREVYEEVHGMIEDGANASNVKKVIRDLIVEADKQVRIVPTEQIDLTIKFPDPVQENPLEQAQRAEVLHRIKVASQPEIAGWFGLDWFEQNEIQSKAGGWQDIEIKPGDTGKSGNKKTPSKPGEVTTTDPEE